MTLKLESYSATTFLVAGQAYLKGSYSIEYSGTRGTDATTGELTGTTGVKVFLRPNAANLNPAAIPPWNYPVSWTSFVDSTGTAYADFDAFTVALAALVAAPSNASVSDLISDRAEITQITSKTTSVTSNTLSTVITTVSLTDAADAAFSFTFTNSKIAATSIVLPSVNMNGGTGKAIITVTPGSGSATVTVTNAGTASFNSAIKIGLVVI